jgi:hypothetical protein
MKRYESDTPTAAMAVAAAIATAVTIGIAVLLPANIDARPDAAVLARSATSPPAVIVVLERIDVVAPRPAPSSAGSAPQAVPAVLSTRQPG